jgi:Fe2+ or Zn2+ uptake regulation protein
MAVYEMLHASDTHPTAEELFRIVKPRTGRLSLATVYNVLEALTKAGLVRRLATVDGCCRYDADMSAHPHVCFPETSEIVDVPRDLSDRLIAALPDETLREIGARLGIRIDRVNIQLVARRQGTDGSIGSNGAAR